MGKKNKVLIMLVLVLLLIFSLVYVKLFNSRKYSIEIKGVTRQYLLHAPNSTSKMPLIIALHGYTDNPRLMKFYSGLSRKSNKEKFIVAYPYGTRNKEDNNLSWNGGSCCGNGVLNNVDDVSFINNLTDELVKKYNIDPKKIYVVGFSNGALLAYRIAAETPERYNAFAIVSGSIGGKVYKNLPEFNISKPKKPVSILMMHGEKDVRISYFGGENQKKDGSFKSFEESTNFWIENNNCINPKTMDNSKVNHKSYLKCDNNVKTETYTVKNSGHIWPGGILELVKNLKGQTVSATDIIWDFFKGANK